MLKLMYNLTGKGKNFLEEMNKNAFEEIKRQLQKPPVSYVSYNKGKCNLYSDTSKFSTGNIIYQIENGNPKLIACASKGMPEAATNYCIMEQK